MNYTDKTELSRKEKLKAKGGALVAVIPFRMASTSYLLVPVAFCVFFGWLTNPRNDFIHGNAAEMAKLSGIAFGIAALLLALAILRPLLTKVKVYEHGLELRRMFVTRILFPEEITYLRAGLLREPPVVGKQTMFQNSMDTISAGRRAYLCIKPTDGKEICLTYKSYGEGLDTLIDWRISHQIPDEFGKIPEAR